MNYSKRSFAIVSVLFAVCILSIILGTGALNARDTDLVPLTLAAAHPPNKNASILAAHGIATAYP